MAQPTTRREKMSSTTARYSQPSAVQIAVISATHAGLGSRGRKLTVEQVGRDRLLVLAIGRSGAMLAWFRIEPVLAHEPGHPLSPASLAFGMQHRMDAWVAIDLPIGVIDTHDMLPQPCILLAAAAGRPPQQA